MFILQENTTAAAAAVPVKEFNIFEFLYEAKCEEMEEYKAMVEADVQELQEGAASETTKKSVFKRMREAIEKYWGMVVNGWKALKAKFASRKANKVTKGKEEAKDITSEIQKETDALEHKMAALLDLAEKSHNFDASKAASLKDEVLEISAKIKTMLQGNVKWEAIDFDCVSMETRSERVRKELTAKFDELAQTATMKEAEYVSSLNVLKQNLQTAMSACMSAASALV